MEDLRAKERVRPVAERRAGRVTFAQLEQLGVARGTFAGWLRTGDLTLVLPRVYAFGHHAPSQMGDLWAAILYAGPGAMLSHITGAWWRELIEFPARSIQVSTPRRVPSLPGIEIHGRRAITRELVRGVPVTSIPQTMLDLAAVAELRLVRKALARLDFRHELDSQVLWDFCGRGRLGSTALRWAIAHYDPRFAQTNSPLEDKYLLFCERMNIPKPDEVGVWIEGIECDAVYHQARVIVQLDGGDNHYSPAQTRIDRANDLILRGHGWIVPRYTWSLIGELPDAVRNDILQALQISSRPAGRSPTAPAAGGRSTRTAAAARRTPRRPARRRPRRA
jgi:hypothetical protein